VEVEVEVEGRRVGAVAQLTQPRFGLQVVVKKKTKEEEEEEEVV
jgi:hypothetical protein